tara:strand:+ start:308 stop:538 length:231 start_codon:yes stop_codon:yes gene_type:complete
MIECVKECRLKNKPCENNTCRKWIDYEEDLNCCLVTIEDNKKDGLTLQETAKRIGLSFVRVRQIEKEAIAKLAKLF